MRGVTVPPGRHLFPAIVREHFSNGVREQFRASGGAGTAEAIERKEEGRRFQGIRLGDRGHEFSFSCLYEGRPERARSPFRLRSVQANSLAGGATRPPVATDP